MTTTTEGVLVILEGDELIGIIRKNGDAIFYKTEKMSMEEIGELLGSNNVK